MGRKFSLNLEEAFQALSCVFVMADRIPVDGELHGFPWPDSLKSLNRNTVVFVRGLQNLALVVQNLRSIDVIHNWIRDVDFGADCENCLEIAHSLVERACGVELLKQ